MSEVRISPLHISFPSFCFLFRLCRWKVIDGIFECLEKIIETDDRAEAGKERSGAGLDISNPDLSKHRKAPFEIPTDHVLNIDANFVCLRFY